MLALAAQFAVGYAMDADDGGQGRGRGRGRGGDSGRGRGRGGDDGGYLDDPDTLVKVHVALGLTILVLAVVRVVWRRVAGLPPWAEQLSPAQRRLAHWTERVLLATLFVIPLSGLALVASGDDDLVWIHVAGPRGLPRGPGRPRRARRQQATAAPDAVRRQPSSGQPRWTQPPVPPATL